MKNELGTSGQETVHDPRPTVTDFQAREDQRLRWDLKMRIVQWIGQPSTTFIYPARW